MHWLGLELCTCNVQHDGSMLEGGFFSREVGFSCVPDMGSRLLGIHSLEFMSSIFDRLSSLSTKEKWGVASTVAVVAVTSFWLSRRKSTLVPVLPPRQHAQQTPLREALRLWPRVQH